MLVPLCVLSPSAFSVPDRVGNFGLIDSNGKYHQLAKYGDRKAVVIISQANGCSAIVEQLHKYVLLRTTWESQGVEFLMLNASGDARDSVNAEARVFDLDFPILMDNSQLVAESLGISKVGEIVVIEPRRGQILYRGALDTPRPRGKSSAAHETPMADVLTSAIAGETTMDTVVVDMQQSCDLQYAARERHMARLPDYATEVAPILEDKCVNCHKDGGIAPFAMDSHQMVQGWSPMIKETLMTKRMPPAQVDPDINHFSNARYMSSEDLQFRLAANLSFI